MDSQIDPIISYLKGNIPDLENVRKTISSALPKM